MLVQVNIISMCSESPIKSLLDAFRIMNSLVENISTNVLLLIVEYNLFLDNISTSSITSQSNFSPNASSKFVYYRNAISLNNTHRYISIKEKEDR